MQGIPVEVEEYLSAGDGLGQAAVVEAHPNVRTTLNAPQTRQALLRYLASDAPWAVPTPGFAVNALTFVLSGARAEELEFVRPLVMHPQPEVRVRAYAVLIAVAAADRPAQTVLFQSMLLDAHDMIRSAGARHVERTQMRREFTSFLMRWSRMTTLGHKDDESHELVARLLRP